VPEPNDICWITRHHELIAIMLTTPIWRLKRAVNVYRVAQLSIMHAELLKKIWWMQTLLQIGRSWTLRPIGKKHLQEIHTGN